MKTTLLILILSLAFITASCQQKTLNYFNKKSWDSLMVLKNNAVTANTTLTASLATANATITTRNNTITSLNSQVSTLTASNNQLLTLNAAISLQNTALENSIDSLLEIDCSQVLVVDTASYTVLGNGIAVELFKKSSNINIEITEKLNRIYIRKYGNDFDAWVQSDYEVPVDSVKSFTRGNLHLDLR